ncbi:glycoside hydrolase family 36 protein [Flagellimonas sp.]|uniref:glycoside hydrolase family 36 protein n=1 Tax=Flagellimonas sp. TaxID=2058762 RepID=UPI003B52D68E
MANLTIKGWNYIERVGSDILPYMGIGIFSKDMVLNHSITNQIEQVEDGLFVISIKFCSETPTNSAPVKLVWKIPAINLKGTWLTDYSSDRRVVSEFDNERMLTSRAAYQAPVVCLFGHDDSNVHTFACSDAINTLSLGTGLYEAEGWSQCNVILFKESVPDFNEYEIKLHLDYRNLRYEAALNTVSNWWASMDSYKPMHVPNTARMPMYSTWYSYNQEMTTNGLLEECRAAKKLGYETIIVDDGWQTKSSEGLYSYTGDWRPERFPNMEEFVKDVHDLDMKAMLWYAVPFFGLKSKAYKRFYGKFLYISDTYETAIVDPRYPDVRDYLINLYVQALREWKLDGFKLDFIDWFIPNEKTALTLENGRDYASVGPAVDRLMTDITRALTAINPEILIEFRQHYIGPTLRKCGNMFRAHDCANDSVSNRRRIIDLRLLTGNTAVHSDMFMWNYDEPVELAALQFANILFSVPQLSVRQSQIPESHRKMVAFYSEYWINNREVFLDGNLKAIGPAENFPLIRANSSKKEILSIHTDRIMDLNGDFEAYDIINAKTSTSVVVSILKGIGSCRISILNCLGEVERVESRVLHKGLVQFEVPVCGLLNVSIN